MTTELPKNNNWFKRAITAGLIAGLIFLIPQMLLLPLFTESTPWTFLTMVAALFLNEQQVLSPPADFDAGIVLTGLVLHICLSLLYSLLFIYASGHLQKSILIISGIFYGIFLYVINFYVFTYAFEWFIDIRHWVNILAHFLYGLALPLLYLAVHKPEEDRPVKIKDK
jgi:hypothetical protein